MPSDDTQDFRARQSDHAAGLAFERQLMDKLGMPRSQARKILNETRKQFSRAENGPAVQLAPVQPVALPSTPIKFEPRPFVQGPAPVAPPAPAAVRSPEQEVTGFASGVIATAKVGTSTGFTEV